MSFKFKVQSSKFKVQSVFCLLAFVCCLFAASCSIPNFDAPECIEARDAVRQFYSFHFGNDMRFNRENLKQREKFLSEDLKRQLNALPDSGTDYFTATDDYPKAFRAGKCESEDARKTVFDIILFWKDETRTEQKTVKAEAVKENDRWLINKVSANDKSSN